MIHKHIDPALLQTICSQYQGKLRGRDAQFLQRVYSTAQQKYYDRLKAIGFFDKDCVLDAGCGFGQWSLALAQLNKAVCAVDIHEQRVEFLNQVAKMGQLSNMQAQRSGLESLPYADSTFDAVFCYGVLFCTDWKKSLQEIARVLKPEGVLYFSFTGLGWYVHLWVNQPNASEDYDPQAYAAQTFANTIAYRKTGQFGGVADLLIDENELLKELESSGMRILARAGEGQINLSSDDVPTHSFFQAEYLGMPGCHEMLVQNNKL